MANIYAPLASGSGAVYINKFSAALVLNLDTLTPKVTWIYCVPSHLQAILSARTPDTKPPSCVRLYRSGAAALRGRRRGANNGPGRPCCQRTP